MQVPENDIGLDFGNSLPKHVIHPPLDSMETTSGFNKLMYRKVKQVDFYTLNPDLNFHLSPSVFLDGI